MDCLYKHNYVWILGKHYLASLYWTKCWSEFHFLGHLYHTDVFDLISISYKFFTLCLNSIKRLNHFSTFHRIAYLSQSRVEWKVKRRLFCRPQSTSSMGLCQGHKSYLDQFTYCKGGLSTDSMLYLLLPFLYTCSRDTVLNDESHCTWFSQPDVM